MSRSPGDATSVILLWLMPHRTNELVFGQAAVDLVGLCDSLTQPQVQSLASSGISEQHRSQIFVVRGSRRLS